jgi:hypothetical protein
VTIFVISPLNAAIAQSRYANLINDPSLESAAPASGSISKDQEMKAHEAHMMTIKSQIESLDF